MPDVIRVITRGDTNLTDSRHVDHIENVFVEFPALLPAGMSDPQERYIIVLIDNKDNYAVLDKGFAWRYNKAHDVESVLECYLKQILKWRVEGDEI